MSDTRVTSILIVAEPALGQCWEQMLRGPEARIWLGRAAIPAGERPEIILTNSHTPPVARRDDAGVIQVGGDSPADVRLSVNCSAAELQLTCRLLGEVVRLRRLQKQTIDTNRELAQVALTDSLTGLANRRAWDQELTLRVTEAADGKRRLCLAVLDLDQFKAINDMQGHAAGDRVLQAASDALRTNLRLGDFVARLGGDEFGLLLWIPGEVEAIAIVDRIRSRVAGASGEQDSARVTASAGFALGGLSDEPNKGESLFLAADLALLAAKRGGRNKSIPHSPSSMKQP